MLTLVLLCLSHSGLVEDGDEGDEELREEMAVRRAKVLEQLSLRCGQIKDCEKGK